MSRPQKAVMLIKAALLCQVRWSSADQVVWVKGP